MVFYRIEVARNFETGSPAIDETIDLTSDQVGAVAAVGTAVFQNERDTIMRISAPTGRILDLDEVLKNTRALAADGEAVFELGPRPGRRWLDLIQENIDEYGIDVNSPAEGKVSKSHTVKAEGDDGTYLIQFDTKEFFDQMVSFLEMIGYNPDDVLVFLHYGNDPLEIVSRRM